jgi:hypothetical protein
VRVSQRIVDTLNAVPLIPAFAQGDTADKPSPTPNITKISDKVAAAAAPAKIAVQETALSCDALSAVDVPG